MKDVPKENRTRFTFLVIHAAKANLHLVDVFSLLFRFEPGYLYKFEDDRTISK